jgi:hypothetical protein
MASAQTQGPAGRWRQIGLVLTMLPMLAGIVLFVAAWADWVFLGSQMGQTMTGALLALLGFAASNALQGRWLLAGGWAGLGIAVALLVGVQQSWAQMFGGLLGGVGVVLLLVEFARRLQAQSRR